MFLQRNIFTPEGALARFWDTDRNPMFGPSKAILNSSWPMSSHDGPTISANSVSRSLPSEIDNNTPRGGS